MTARTRTSDLFRRAARKLVYGTTLGRMLDKLRGGGHRPDHATAAYWDRELQGQLRSYLGGTFSIDLRNAAVVQLVRHAGLLPSSLLDVGCAAGSLAKAFAPAMPGRYVGLDISRVAIEAADPAVGRFHVANLCDWHPEPEERFDAIVFQEVLYYLDPDQAVAEMSRYAGWLTANGVIVLSLKHDPKSEAIAAEDPQQAGLGGGDRGAGAGGATALRSARGRRATRLPARHGAPRPPVTRPPSLPTQHLTQDPLPPGRRRGGNSACSSASQLSFGRAADSVWSHSAWSSAARISPPPSTSAGSLSCSSLLLVWPAAPHCAAIANRRRTSCSRAQICPASTRPCRRFGSGRCDVAPARTCCLPLRAGGAGRAGRRVLVLLAPGCDLLVRCVWPAGAPTLTSMRKLVADTNIVPGVLRRPGVTTILGGGD